jgi:hypothetical protein
VVDGDLPFFSSSAETSISLSRDPWKEPTLLGS